MLETFKMWSEQFCFLGIHCLGTSCSKTMLLIPACFQKNQLKLQLPRHLNQILLQLIDVSFDLISFSLISDTNRVYYRRLTF